MRSQMATADVLSWVFFLFVFGFDGENAILAIELESHFATSLL